jgi:hypothetical protein
MYSFLICNRMLVMRDKECVLILVLFRKRKRTQEDLAQEESLENLLDNFVAENPAPVR